MFFFKGEVEDLDVYMNQGKDLPFFFRYIICLTNIGTLDINRLCNKAERKKNICFLFSNFTHFYIYSAYISKSWFFRKTISFAYNFCATCISKFLFLT